MLLRFFLPLLEYNPYLNYRLGVINKRRRHFLHPPPPCRRFLIQTIYPFDQFLTPSPIPIANVVYGRPLRHLNQTTKRGCGRSRLCISTQKALDPYGQRMSSEDSIKKFSLAQMVHMNIPPNIVTSVKPISTRGADYAPTSLLAPLNFQTFQPP